ncbi:Bug family tripartite tricarboxylate transporter substrate binding protein [Variovorax boronicumulans]
MKHENQREGSMSPGRRIALQRSTAIAMAAGFAMVPAWAQSYPSKPVRWIVPWPAGGSADLLARVVGQKLSEKWGQQVLIDNKPGGQTLIGASEAIHAAADGYTLFQPLNTTLAVNQFMYSKLPYDPIKDFTHITQLASLPLVIMTNEPRSITNIANLVAAAKAKPESIAFGFPNPVAQIAGEQFARAYGIKLTPVPYKGTADVVKGMLSGEIQIAFDGVAPYVGHLKSGRLRALASTGKTRAASLPEVPTLIELGQRGYDYTVWHGLSAPAGLSKSVQDKIQRDVQLVLSDPEVSSKLLAAGIEVVGSSPEEFSRTIQSDIKNLGPLVKEYGIRAD